MRVAVLSIAALALANPACAQLSTLPLRGGSKRAKPKAMSLKGTESFVEAKTGMGDKGKDANSGRWRPRGLAKKSTHASKKKSAKKKSGMSLGAKSNKGMSGKGQDSKAGKLFKA